MGHNETLNQNRPLCYLKFILCITDCPSQQFGSDCDGVCHCSGGAVCDKKTGECPDGCDDRYGGRNCSVG